jgi:hypothetical protein
MSHDSVDSQQPWLGLDSFSEDTRGYFHGREEEIAELARRVQRKPLTVLFGQSGLGKTSILRAGLVPRLRPEGYCPVYLRVDYNADAPPPAEQLKLAVFRETQASGTWSKIGVAVEGESLWEFLHHRDDQLVDAEGRELTPLIIFDQFEEIFTLAQADEAGRARAALFIQELADLVENRPPRALEVRLEHDDTVVDRFDFARCDYRVLIALREDYLAHLEALKSSMPSITQNRMRLARMTGTQALEAVLKPGGALVTQEVAESIVRFVAGGAELRNAEVEPSLLSLICRELNATRITQGKGEISADLLAGSHATILAEFYQRALADQPPGVHRFIEDELLTDSGFRENVAQERVLKAFAEAGAKPDALARLVDRRLLRIEERLDVRRVELTHDVLCSVVGAARQVRQERDARDAAEAQLAAQREREATTRAALVRARKVAAVCGVLAVVAAGAAGFGIWGMREAQSTRAVAEAARGESERLIVYLLDDFYRELEPVGRLDIVGELAKRALDYYGALPAELRSPETERNQALAQMRYGAVLRVKGRLEEARATLGAAVTTLDALRARGDQSEAATIGLALGLAEQSRAVTPAGFDRSSVPPAERAVALLAPAAAASSASVALRRAHATVLTQLGLVQTRQRIFGPAVAALEAATATWRSIDPLLAGSEAAAHFGIATARLVEAYNATDRQADAERAGEDGLRATSKLIESQPTNSLALRARASISESLVGVALSQMQMERTLHAANEAARDWALLSRIDPSDMFAKHNLMGARSDAFVALRAQGRPRESLAKILENREFAETAKTSTMVSGRLSDNFNTAAYMAADLGQADAAAHYLAERQRFSRISNELGSRPPFIRQLFSVYEQIRPMEVALLLGDLTRARTLAKGLREELLALPATNDFERRRVAAGLIYLHSTLGRVALQARDFAEARQHFGRVAEARKQMPPATLDERRGAAEEASLLAIALAHTGQLVEARALAEPALSLQRELDARRTDEQMHKLDLCLALVATAAATPGQAKLLLVQAQAAFNSLSAEARELRSSQMVQDLIAYTQRHSPSL